MEISGACGREELCKMTIDDIKFKVDVVVVVISQTKTNVSQRFAISEPAWIQLILKYKEPRPKNAIKRFFLTYRIGRCVNSPKGINTIGKISCKIAEYLKLEAPSLYTGHCFRRSSATLLANHEDDLLTLKRLGWVKKLCCSRKLCRKLFIAKN